MTGDEPETAAPVTAVPAGWARTSPDSSNLLVPQVLSPIYVAMGELDATVEAYETALGVEVVARLPMPELGVTIISVGGLAIIGRTAEARDVDDGVDRIIMVADLDSAAQRIVAAGMEVVLAPVPVPPGRLMHVRGPNGSLDEWLEYRPLPGESPASVA